MQKWLLAFPLFLLLLACEKDENVPPQVTDPPIIVDPPIGDENPFDIRDYLSIDFENLPNYADIAWPDHYDEDVFDTDNTPANNPITDRGATLGRVLFFDELLSINDAISCASCHQQTIGFTDENQFSFGLNGVDITGAHSMRLGNARFYEPGEFFWDRRAVTLEEQTLMPIQDHIEMGFTAEVGGLDSLMRKLAEQPYYEYLFNFVYGDAEVTQERVQSAMAQFIRSMASTDSRFDEAYAQVYDSNAPGNGIGMQLPGFTASENRGLRLFILPPNQDGAGCAGCHNIPTFSLAANSRSNGLDVGETIIFKSPSLKNIEFGGPYMHDGRFTTLEEVVEHYNSGVQLGPALDNRLRVGQGPNVQPQQLNLNDQEKIDLVAFLGTLTDTDLCTDPKFLNPFVN